MPKKRAQRKPELDPKSFKVIGEISDDGLAALAELLIELARASANESPQSVTDATDDRSQQPTPTTTGQPKRRGGRR
jgi:hypothetical protein